MTAHRPRHLVACCLCDPTPLLTSTNRMFPLGSGSRRLRTGILLCHFLPCFLSPSLVFLCSVMGTESEDTTEPEESREHDGTMAQECSSAVQHMSRLPSEGLEMPLICQCFLWGISLLMGLSHQRTRVPAPSPSCNQLAQSPRVYS